MPNHLIYLYYTAIAIFVSSSARSRPHLVSLSADQEMKRPADTVTVNALNKMADQLIDDVQLDSALSFANRARQLAIDVRYQQGELVALFHISTINYRKGDYDHALQASTDQLQKAIAYGDLLHQTRANNTIGLIHLVQKNHQEALASLKKAAATSKRIKKMQQLATNRFNIALVFMETQQLDSAYHYLMTSRAIVEKKNFPWLMAMINNRLGEYYFKRDDVSKSIEYYGGVIADTTYQSDWENSFALTGLANCHYRLGKYELAKNEASEALTITLKLNTKWDTERTLDILHRIYRELGDYPSAYRYLSMQKSYSDSLLNESKEIEINAIHLKRQKIENETLAEKNKVYEENLYLNRLVTWVIVLVALLLCVLALVFYRNVLRKNKLNKELRAKSEEITAKQQLIEQQNQELTQLNHTKDQIFSIIGHDLRSPFNSIISALDLIKMGYLSDEEKEQLFVQFYKQVNATSILLENLLLWAASQMNGISTRMAPCYLSELMQEVISTFSTTAKEKQISIKHVQENATRIYADHGMVRIVLQNIISNAIKFTPNGGFIHIDYTHEAEGIVLRIQDDGIGMPKERLDNLFHKVGYSISTYGTNKERGNGLGLMLVKRFIEMNDANIQIDSKENQGTTVTIIFCSAPVEFPRPKKEQLPT